MFLLCKQHKVSSLVLEYLLWFKFYFPLFQTHYHTYKNNRKKKFEPRTNLNIHSSNNQQEWRSGESTRLPPMWPCFDSGLAVICGLSLLLVLVLAPRGFSPGTRVFPSPQKPTFPNYNLIWIIFKHFDEPLAREIAQALPVLLALNKLLFHFKQTVDILLLLF